LEYIRNFYFYVLAGKMSATFLAEKWVLLSWWQNVCYFLGGKMSATFLAAHFQQYISAFWKVEVASKSILIVPFFTIMRNKNPAKYFYLFNLVSFPFMNLILFHEDLSCFINPLTRGIGLVYLSKVWRLITKLWNVEKIRKNNLFHGNCKGYNFNFMCTPLKLILRAI